MEKMDDREIIRRAQSGDKLAFGALFDTYYPCVYRYLHERLGGAPEAEDLCQEAFVRAYRARDRYRPSAPPGAWLHRIAINVAISHLRREKLSRLFAPRLLAGPDPGGYERADARTLLERALARLSPKLRAAVVLHYYHGYTREEVGRILRIPAGTVASRIAKAMALMRQELVGNEQFPITVRSQE